MMTALSAPFWKFSRIDANTYKMLLNQKLWFSHPRHFNDPFDSDGDIREFVERMKDRFPDPALLKQTFDNTLKGYDEFLKRRFVFCVVRGSGEKPWTQP